MLTSSSPAISEVILEIILTGILRIRAAGWDNQPELCAQEADHIHNLPTLVQDFRPELLDYYWNVERSAYIAGSSSTSLKVWEPLWERLMPFVRKLDEPAPSR
jgi:hypothetical protein